MKFIVKNKKTGKNYSGLPAGPLRQSFSAASRQGFSLIETLFAVFLVTIGLLASVRLVSQGLFTSLDSRNQLVAGELAQEGVELVRNIRDNNWASGDAGGSFAHIINGNNCKIDETYTYPVSPAVPANIVCDGSSKALNDDVDNKDVFVHTAVNSPHIIATKFSRQITISDDVSSNKVITSFVTWNGSVPPTDIATCNTATHCAYTQIILTKWGGN